MSRKNFSELDFVDNNGIEVQLFLTVNKYGEWTENFTSREIVKWREKNREKVNEYSKKWRERNPDKALEADVKYKLNNKDKIRERNRSYRLRHPEKCKTKWRFFQELSFRDESTDSQIIIGFNINKDGEWSESFSYQDANKVRGYCRRATSKWIKNNLEKYKDAKKKWWRENPEKVAEQNNKRRDLGFTPLNSWFKGSEAHHIDEEHVIYMPAKIHQSIYHCLESGEGMEEINEIAFRFLESERKQASKLEEFAEV